MSVFLKPFDIIYKFILNNVFDLTTLLMISFFILIFALLTGKIKKTLRLAISSFKSTYKISLYIIFFLTVNYFFAFLKDGESFTYIKYNMELIYYFEILLIIFLFITLYHLVIIQSSKRDNLIFLLVRSMTILLFVTLLNYIIFYINNNPDEFQTALLNIKVGLIKIIFGIIVTYIYLVNDTIIYIAIFVLSIAALVVVFGWNNDDFNEEGIKKEKLSSQKNIFAISLTVIIYLPIFSQLIKI